MKQLKAVFKANLVRYNFGDPFMGMSQEYENYPTERELMDFLSVCNENDEYHKNYQTKITVEKVYNVINV